MLGDKTAVACLAVKDMDVAKKFYGETLGLSEDTEQAPGGVLYKTGNSNIFVYQSPAAGSNQATAVAFGVGENIEAAVNDLKAKGVTFEHYDNIPGASLQGDVHVMGNMKSAWFKDPDGNILNLVNRM